MVDKILWQRGWKGTEFYINLWSLLLSSNNSSMKKDIFRQHQKDFIPKTLLVPQLKLIFSVKKFLSEKIFL